MKTPPCIFNYMVKYSFPSLDRTFSALAHSTRRAILARLARGDTSVTELAEPFSISLPAISRHLRVLENARLIQRQKHGRVHSVQLAPRPMKDAARWLHRYRRIWEKQFDALADHLDRSNTKAQ